MAKLRYIPMRMKTVSERMVKEHMAREPDWSYEVKFDGHRTQAFRDDQGIHLVSRQGADVTDGFPEVVAALTTAIAARRWVLDGELIGLDERGYHWEKLVRNKWSKKQFICFDLLELRGRPLIEKPLSERREKLTEILKPSSVVLQSVVSIVGVEMIDFVKEHNLEGVVAKRSGSKYRPGKLSSEWLRVINPERKSPTGKRHRRS